MLLQWNALFENEKKQCTKMNEKEKYIYFLLMQYRSPYLWGKENPEGADCSGAVCLALMMSTGCEMRTTADGLLKKFFTARYPTDRDIQAVFYTARTDRRHGDRIARKGEAVHVTGVIGEGVVFNAAFPASDIQTLETMRINYTLQECDTVIRGLDRKALQLAHERKSDLFGMDEELDKFFKRLEQ